VQQSGTIPQITNPGALWDESLNFYPRLGGTPHLRMREWRWPRGGRIKFAHLQFETTVYDWQGMHGWITDRDFTNIFAVAQAIPGPNMILMMGLIGWKVSGLAGGLAAATAIFAPPCAIYFAAFRLMHRLQEAHWQRVLRSAHSCDHRFDYRERPRNGTCCRYHLGSHSGDRRRRYRHADDAPQSALASSGRRRLGRPRFSGVKRPSHRAVVLMSPK
jgi:Chromate transporter